ncbi:hypothetical protein Hanom_Chr11g01016341 [Helianthus anomalus]
MLKRTNSALSKDKDLHAKDVEIAELKCRLREQTNKSGSLEIDLEAERVKVATAKEVKQRAEEARDISTSSMNVAQKNYADTLVSEFEWMRSRGVVLVRIPSFDLGFFFVVFFVFFSSVDLFVDGYLYPECFGAGCGRCVTPQKCLS